MAGTKVGGAKAAAKNKATNPNFYQDIGKLGGTKSRGGGFADRELAKRAGKLGGAKSRRGPSKKAPKETLFVDDAILVDEEFGAGFFEPTWKQRMLGRLRIYNGK